MFFFLIWQTVDWYIDSTIKKIRCERDVTTIMHFFYYFFTSSVYKNKQIT